MSTNNAHIIIVDGFPSSGKKLFGLELAITLMYNDQKTAILLPSSSPLRTIIENRKKTHPFLPSPDIIERSNFNLETKNYDAILIPGIPPSDELASNVDTYITILTSKTIQKFEKDKNYINKMWELKKHIASCKSKSLNWVILENHLKEKSTLDKSKQLQTLSKLYGFRVAPPINKRQSYLETLNGISSQDKTFSSLKNDLTYEDICAKREITKLAEFIFNQ
jgi:hypothetical protein